MPTDHPPPTSPRPVSDEPRFHRASVPVPPPALREPTTEFPEADRPGTGPSGVRVKPVSWRRTSSASRRSLADGWGFTATGLVIAFSGWGVWAAALRGSGTSAVFGFIFMIIVAAGLFALARFFGYLVLEQIMHRQRLHARWSHGLTGLFLTVAGLSYLVNTVWLTESGEWLVDRWEWVSGLWSDS